MFIKRPAPARTNDSACQVCGKPLDPVGRYIGVCPACVRERWEECRAGIGSIHAQSREMFGLPVKPPQNAEGIKCNLCSKSCRMGVKDKGYCGVRTGNRTSLRKDGRSRAKVSYYYDPLPTNCVADWVCPGGTGAGFPRFSNDAGPEVGYQNLAVFFEACNFNCLYCQNWSFKKTQISHCGWSSVDCLAEAVRPNTSCICFFGGDPGPQLPYALRVSEMVRAAHPERVLRICWETNGTMSPSWLKPMARLSLESGGCIKVDLKAWNPKTHMALCGCDNRAVLDNFARLAGWAALRPSPPLLIASTPLVPGYIDEAEVAGIASFIAGLDPDIPYVLLAFAPQFMMDDFPTTSVAQAKACLEAAKGAGLTRVRIGNEHLLS